MRTRLALAVTLGLALVVPASAAPVLADQSFHTTRLSVSLTSAGASAEYPALRAGQVVDIHANGPVVFAIENYLLNGAKPMTSYAVWLNFYLGSCAGAGAPTFTLANGVTLTTDAIGNAHGQARLAPDAAVGLHDTDWGIVWTFVDGSVAAYATDCANVHID